MGDPGPGPSAIRCMKDGQGKLLPPEGLDGDSAAHLMLSCNNSLIPNLASPASWSRVHRPCQMVIQSAKPRERE